jgi:hypothetical protein
LWSIKELLHFVKPTSSVRHNYKKAPAQKQYNAVVNTQNINNNINNNINSQQNIYTNYAHTNKTARAKLPGGVSPPCPKRKDRKGTKKKGKEKGVEKE